MKYFLIAAAVLLAAAAFGFFWFARFAYKKAFYHPKEKRADIFTLPPGKHYEEKRDYMLSLIEATVALEYERVSTAARDGLKLNGNYYESKNANENAILQIEFHGYRGSAYRDFCGGTRIALEAGCNVLAVEQRANGESESSTITFGIKERFDCLCWIDYAIKRFGSDVRIILSGVSMGAATVLMAAGEVLPENVIGIIADCPYSSPLDIIEKVGGDMGLPKKAAGLFSLIGARLFGGFNLRESSAVEAVKKTDLPILIFHGEDDNFVPCEMSRRIAKAGKTVRLETFPEAAHALSFIKDEPRYRALLAEFLSNF
ncbi:MAG: alpha/beta hydrolase [Clostridia bacterium]|nr:alpha/beta hydrolase [Clostridia bacterium]